MLELIKCVNNLLQTKTKYVQISTSLQFWKEEDELDFYDDDDEKTTFTETLS